MAGLHDYIISRIPANASHPAVTVVVFCVTRPGLLWSNAQKMPSWI